MSIKIRSREVGLKKYIQSVEKREVFNALRATGNNKYQAAKILKINRTTLIEKVRKYYPSLLNDPLVKFIKTND